MYPCCWCNRFSCKYVPRYCTAGNSCYRKTLILHNPLLYIVPRTIYITELSVCFFPSLFLEQEKKSVHSFRHLSLDTAIEIPKDSSSRPLHTVLDISLYYYNTRKLWIVLGLHRSSSRRCQGANRYFSQFKFSTLAVPNGINRNGQRHIHWCGIYVTERNDPIFTFPTRTE